MEEAEELNGACQEFSARILLVCILMATGQIDGKSVNRITFGPSILALIMLFKTSIGRAMPMW